MLPAASSSRSAQPPLPPASTASSPKTQPNNPNPARHNTTFIPADFCRGSLAAVSVGMWAKASISPRSELAREAGGSGAGRQRRSSTYPQPFLVNLPRRAITEALMLAFLIVEAEPGANAGLGLGNRRIGVEVDFLIFQASPQPLDENVVHVAALAV